MSGDRDSALALVADGAIATWLRIDPRRPRNTTAAAPLGWIGYDRLDVLCAHLPRNASKSRLTYRPVGSPGEPYPTWVRELKGKSGAYAIRDRKSGEVLYVGTSYTGNLYETMTRHLQRWKRWKSWWSGQYGDQQHDPGTTYERDRVEVAVRVTPPKRALDEEARLIRTLKPKDNLIGQPPELEPELEPVPF
jgi:hypothetical protein